MSLFALFTPRFLLDLMKLPGFIGTLSGLIYVQSRHIYYMGSGLKGSFSLSSLVFSPHKS